MKLNAYVIFDVKSGLYMRPFFTGADGEATRSFCDLAKDKSHPVGAHPEDYSLFRVGSFNDNTAVLHGDELKECLMTGIQATSDAIGSLEDIGKAFNDEKVEE